ncbi:MAG: glycosyltransferase [Lachnospiraceae bacterium]|nr:glycosyltransferase [Lachnospiraceae bacterium]
MKHSAGNWNNSSTEPLKVLHIVSGMDAGGLETLIMNLYHNMDRSKIRFDYLCFRDQQEFYDEEFLALGGQKHVILPEAPQNLADRIRIHRDYARQYYDLIRENHYEVVHIHFGIPDSFRWIRLAHKAGVRKVILHVHRAQAIQKEPRLFRLRNQLAFYMADESIACSRLAADYFFGKRLGARTTILKNGIDVEKYAYSEENRKAVRAEFKIPEDAFVIGHVGGLKYPKNQAFLITLLNRIKEDIPDARLLLVGDGPDREKLLKQAEEIGVLDRLTITGSRNDVNRILSAMDVFLFPSIHEGLGIAPIEAQTNGLPVAVSDTVPRDIQCTKAIGFLSLSDMTAWISFLQTKRKQVYDRQAALKAVKDSDFNSSRMASVMDKIYRS